MGFKDQLQVIRELMEEKEIGEHLYRLFRETILTYDDAHARRQKAAASREQQRQAPPPRSKGGLWPDGGGTTLRDASSTDTKPYADIGCDDPADQYTTILKISQINRNRSMEVFFQVICLNLLHHFDIFP